MVAVLTNIKHFVLYSQRNMYFDKKIHMYIDNLTFLSSYNLCISNHIKFTNKQQTTPRSKI